MKKLKVCFTGGGTGGHIYPGLAVCDELKKICKQNEINLELWWFGSSKGMDKNLVENNVDENGEKSVDHFVGIPSGKLRRYFSFKNFFDIFRIFAGFVVSFFKILKIKPDILFSKGGFVSVPPCFSAKLLKVPVFTHECDFTPGLATRLNSKSAKKILLSYKETASYFPPKIREKTVVTGNPIRPYFYLADKKKGLDFLNIPETHEKPILLVLGGSSGALQINNLIVENIDFLTERFIVVHQTGKNFSCNIQNPSYIHFDFIYSEMKDVVKASDIVLSRAGANSIWECSVCAKPMVLIPLCGSGTRGDQVDNAAFFEKSGAAKVLLGKDCTSENLKKALLEISQKENLEKFAENSKKLSEGEKPALKIASIIFSEIAEKQEIK